MIYFHDGHRVRLRLSLVSVQLHWTYDDYRPSFIDLDLAKVYT